MFCDRPQRDAGSNASAVELYYIATYQYELKQTNAVATGANWRLRADSSVNTDHGAPLVDMAKFRQSGGAQYWDQAFYPAGASGVGPPGMMFVISCKQCSR